jgi:epoxyqueuosine reductase QueG
VDPELVEYLDHRFNDFRHEITASAARRAGTSMWWRSS